MPFNWLDFTVIGGYIALMVIVGYYAQKRGQDTLEDYFTGSKNLPRQHHPVLVGPALN